jgi:hypothetical protein
LILAPSGAAIADSIEAALDEGPVGETGAWI